jgi:hypothetical protein
LRERRTIAVVIGALLLEPAVILAKHNGWVAQDFPSDVDPAIAVPVAALALLAIIVWNLR